MHFYGIFWILDFSILDFWIFVFLEFLDFRSRCLIPVLDKWAKCAFLRVVGGVSIYIYIYGAALTSPPLPPPMV